MGCRLVQAATLAAFIHIVFTSEVIAQDPTDLDKDDVPGRMLTHLRKNYSGQKRFFLSMEIKNCYCWICCGCPSCLYLFEGIPGFFPIFALQLNCIRKITKFFHHEYMFRLKN